LRLEIHPLRAQKTLNIAALVASFIEITSPSRPESSDRLNLFSAKDAKDAKKTVVMASVQGATTPIRLWYSESLDL
jgi:hypothetical protein